MTVDRKIDSRRTFSTSASDLQLTTLAQKISIVDLALHISQEKRMQRRYSRSFSVSATASREEDSELQNVDTKKKFAYIEETLDYLKKIQHSVDSMAMSVPLSAVEMLAEKSEHYQQTALTLLTLREPSEVTSQSISSNRPRVHAGGSSEEIRMETMSNPRIQLQDPVSYRKKRGHPAFRNTGTLTKRRKVPKNSKKNEEAK